MYLCGAIGFSINIVVFGSTPCFSLSHFFYVIYSLHPSFTYFHLYQPFVYSVIYLIDVVSRNTTFLLLDVPDILWVCHVLTFTERAESHELQSVEVEAHDLGVDTEWRVVDDHATIGARVVLVVPTGVERTDY